MNRFIQLHLLTNYPACNLNRDDTGRPKSVLLGNATRLRISSQSLKRAWRTSDTFQEALAGYIGTRTKRLGKEVFEALKKAGVSEEKARDWAKLFAGCFGKLKTKEKKRAKGKADKGEENKDDKNEELEIEQLAHISPEERKAALDLANSCASRCTGPSSEELALLRKPQQAVDIAMFGRMLADHPEFNMEAAVQVSHAITVHKSVVEDDYFIAIDDLNRDAKNASHIGERGYGAGLFYLYLCINRELLKENLGGDDALTSKALDALVHSVTKVSPTGMQNSFASRAYASYVLAEKGDQQPRSLADAFLKPVNPSENKGMFKEAVTAIEKLFGNFDAIYGPCADERYSINLDDPDKGRLDELIKFVQE